MTIQRSFAENGEIWSGRAQAWMFDLFDLAWGLRNADEHGVDLETQRSIRLANCDRAIRRLYVAGESLPLHERYPFRDPMEDLFVKSVASQERWITLTEDYLPVARRRIKSQEKKNQRSLKEFYSAPQELPGKAVRFSFMSFF